MLSVSVVATLSCDIVIARKPAALTSWSRDYASSLATNDYVLAFRKRFRFDVRKDGETEHLSYLGWLSVGVLIDATKDLLVVRTVHTMADVPLLGNSTGEPDHAIVVAMKGHRIAAGSALDATTYQAVRAAYRAQCLAEQCLLPQQPQSAPFCVNCSARRSQRREVEDEGVRRRNECVECGNNTRSSDGVCPDCRAWEVQRLHRDMMPWAERDESAYRRRHGEE